jgi:aspartokinase/homoserine dehydrogenase 1
VGAKLIEQIHSQYETLKEESGLLLNVVGIASSKKAIFSREGIDLTTYKEKLNEAEPSNSQKMLDGILNMNIFNSVFVDCTASKEVADLYQALLEHNVNIITANKIAASGDYETYHKLKETAKRVGVKFRYETNVGAGLPIIGTMNDLTNSGDKILKIEAVLSGTLNYIFNALSEDTPFSETVKKAKELGFAEPDPRIDLSGTDVIRKLVILTREAGYKVEQSDVEKHLFVPEDFFQGSLEDFWRRLPELDAQFEAKRKELEARNCRQRFVASMEVDGGKVKCCVSLRDIPMNHEFYELEGSNNIVTFTTSRYKEYPMLIQGFGAGASVTAAGVFANVLSIANI